MKSIHLKYIYAHLTLRHFRSQYLGQDRISLLWTGHSASVRNVFPRVVNSTLWGVYTHFFNNSISSPTTQLKKSSPWLPSKKKIPRFTPQKCSNITVNPPSHAISWWTAYASAVYLSAPLNQNLLLFSQHHGIHHRLRNKSKLASLPKWPQSKRIGVQNIVETATKWFSQKSKGLPWLQAATKTMRDQQPNTQRSAFAKTGRKEVRNPKP